MSDARTLNSPDANMILPDFCGIRTVFSVVLLGQLLAFLLVLTPFADTPGSLRELGIVSLFVQWVGLVSTAFLCVTRRFLSTVSTSLAICAALAIVLIVTWVLSELAYRFFVPGLQAVDARVWQFDAGPDGLGPAYPVDQFSFSHLEFVLRNVAISAIVGALALRYFFVQHQWRSRIESETNARIQALQSRIRPHFLFNSMNTIASLTRTDPELAEQVTEDLADLFRVSLSDARVSSTLAEEIEIARRYLRIEQQRLGERLTFSINSNGLPEQAKIPGLTIQPLAENAVYHGIEPGRDGGEVVIEGKLLDGEIILLIRNTRPRDAQARARRGHKMAQANVQERLSAFFGEKARMTISESEQFYVVEIRFPDLSDREHVH